MSEQKPAPKTTAANLPDYSDVFAAPSTGKLINIDPRFHYEWFNEDRVNEHLNPQVLSDGTATRGWAVVFEADATHPYGPRFLRRFSDDTVGRDTVVRRRNQVLMCIPMEDFERLVKDHDRKADLAEASLKRGQSISLEGGQIRMEDGMVSTTELAARFPKQ